MHTHFTKGFLLITTVCSLSVCISLGVTREIASTLDILPTIASLAGAKLPQVKLDGVDMTKILFKQGKVMASYLTLWNLKHCENHADVFIFYL